VSESSIRSAHGISYGSGSGIIPITDSSIKKLTDTQKTDAKRIAVGTVRSIFDSGFAGLILLVVRFLIRFHHDPKG